LPGRVEFLREKTDVAFKIALALRSLKFSFRNRANLSTIAKTLLRLYGSADYLDHFSWVDNIRPVQDEAIFSALEAAAVEAVQRSRLNFMGPEQITEFAGAVADGVTSIKLYLASGRVIPAALRDNAYTVAGPTAQFPAKLVAFDAKGRVVGLQVLGGPARATPCPPLSVWSAARLPATHPYQRLDLGSLTVNGHRSSATARRRSKLPSANPIAYRHRRSTTAIRSPRFSTAASCPVVLC
jgi:hypothetical protein